MTNERKMVLMGQILTRCGALGDTELAAMMGELMSGIGQETAAATPASAEVYVICIEATLPDGTKVQHPLIGGYSVPTCIEDYKMMTGSSLTEVQRQADYMREMVERMYPVKVRVVGTSEENIAELQKRLAELLTNLMGAIDEAAEAKQRAYNMMNVNVGTEDISDDMLKDIMRQTLYAGSALSDDGKSILEREDGVSYQEEEEIRNRSNDYEDDDEESEYDEEEEDEYDDYDDDEYDYEDEDEE